MPKKKNKKPLKNDPGPPPIYFTPEEQREWHLAIATHNLKAADRSSLELFVMAMSAARAAHRKFHEAASNPHSPLSQPVIGALNQAIANAKGLSVFHGGTPGNRPREVGDRPVDSTEAAVRNFMVSRNRKKPPEAPR